MIFDPAAPRYRPCVGIAVLNAHDKIWIGRRADAKDEAEGAGSWWQMPQGGIDQGEDPAKAALRELYEETGMTSVTIITEIDGWHFYDLPPILRGRAWGGRYRGQKQKWFVMRFTGNDSEINITPGDGHQIEFDAWRWADINEVAGLIVPFKREVYNAVLAELNTLLAAKASTQGH